MKVWKRTGRNGLGGEEGGGGLGYSQKVGSCYTHGTDFLVNCKDISGFNLLFMHEYIWDKLFWFQLGFEAWVSSLLVSCSLKWVSSQN